MIISTFFCLLIINHGAVAERLGPEQHGLIPLQAYFKSIIERLNRTDAEMFNFFSDDRHNYASVVQELIAYEEKTEYNYLLDIERVLNRLGDIQTKLRLIGGNLREHKFQDYDWRQLPSENNNLIDPDIYTHDEIKKKLRYTLYQFPVPKIINEPYELVDECEPETKTSLSCIDKVYESFSKNIEVEKVLDLSENTKSKEILLKLAPFPTHLKRWQYRATAAYYMCYYTILKNRAFAYFGAKCSSHVDSSLKYYRTKTEDLEAFDCALLSFCPDFCYGDASKQSGPFKQELTHFLKHEKNPCNRIRNGTCSISFSQNTNLDSFKANEVNLTCDCDVGYMFLTKFGICIDVDECDTGAHTCHGPHETCLNTVGSFECTCKRGFKMKFSETTTTTAERKCVRFNDLEKAEDEIDEENRNYNNKRDILIDVFKIIHNKTKT